MVLEEVFSHTKWENKGLKINGEIANNLRFVNDVVVISDRIEELEEMGNELARIWQRGWIKDKPRKKHKFYQIEMKQL